MNAADLRSRLLLAAAGFFGLADWKTPIERNFTACVTCNFTPTRLGSLLNEVLR